MYFSVSINCLDVIWLQYFIRECLIIAKNNFAEEQDLTRDDPKDVSKSSPAKSNFGLILGSNDVLPQGESQGKIFLTLTPLGGDGGQKSILGSYWDKMEKWPQFSQLSSYFWNFFIE